MVPVRRWETGTSLQKVFILFQTYLIPTNDSTCEELPLNRRNIFANIIRVLFLLVAQRYHLILITSQIILLSKWITVLVTCITWTASFPQTLARTHKKYQVHYIIISPISMPRIQSGPWRSRTEPTFASFGVESSLQIQFPSGWST